MIKIPSLGLSLKLAAVVFGLTAYSSQAQIIISDSFTGTNGTLLTAHTPNISLPGANFYGNNGNTDSPWAPANISNNTAKLDTDLGAAITIASAGSYTKPTSLSISANLNLGTLPANGGAAGVGLGFFPVLGTTNLFHGFTGFNGLTLQKDGGLKLIVNGALVGSAIAYTGPFDSAIFHSLSYQVNTTTGNFSNVVLDGTAYTFASSTAFTNTATAYAGFYVNGQLGFENGYVDNFQVAAVPEPSTVLLAGLGAALVLFRRRGRRML